MQRPVPRLNALARLAYVTVLSAATLSCVRRYKPPTPDQPHAIAKVRRNYETTQGTRLSERVLVNGFLVPIAKSQVLGGLRTDGTLIHPGLARWKVTVTFSHPETRQVRESYIDRESYLDRESYSCGSFDSPRTCYRSVTRYRSKTKWRTRWKTVDVVDARCESNLVHVARDGQRYILDYTYQDDGVCTFQCYVQTESGNERCPVTSVKD